MVNDVVPETVLISPFFERRRSCRECYEQATNAYAEGNFVFCTFLEIHTALLLQAQDDILQLESAWFASSRNKNRDDFPREHLKDLREKIKDYCTAC